MLIFSVVCASSTSKQHNFIFRDNISIFVQARKLSTFCIVPIDRVIARLSIFMFDGC